MARNSEVRFEWCAETGSSKALGKFFADNITTSYISHSELQGPRAIDPTHWRPDIREIFEREIFDRIQRTRGAISNVEATYPIFAGWDGSDLVVFGMASFFPDAPVSYAMLEDIVVSTAKRGVGIGTQAIKWIASEAAKIGCKRVFLESGVENHHAHELFEREGFKQTSMVMMKEL